MLAPGRPNVCLLLSEFRSNKEILVNWVVLWVSPLGSPKGQQHVNRLTCVDINKAVRLIHSFQGTLFLTVSTVPSRLHLQYSLTNYSWVSGCRRTETHSEDLRAAQSRAREFPVWREPGGLLLSNMETLPRAEHPDFCKHSFCHRHTENNE